MLRILFLMMISMKIPSIATVGLSLALANSPALAQPPIEQTRFETSSQTNIVLNSVEANLKERISNERIRITIIQELRNLSGWDISTIESFTLGNWGDSWNISISIILKNKWGSKATTLHFSPKDAEEISHIWTLNF